MRLWKIFRDIFRTNVGYFFRINVGYPFLSEESVLDISLASGERFVNFGFCFILTERKSY